MIMCTKMIYVCFVLLLSLAGFVKGSCLEYGHSCWGAHGKRSGGKIYRSIDGSESQQSETNRDIPLTQDKLKPRELFGFLLERNGRINLDDAKTPLEINSPNNANENMFDASEQRLRRKLKNAFRKGAIYNYLPKTNDYVGSTESSAVRRNPHPSAGSSSEYYQIENYPSLNLEMEYLDLK